MDEVWLLALAVAAQVSVAVKQVTRAQAVTAAALFVAVCLACVVYVRAKLNVESVPQQPAPTSVPVEVKI